MHLPHAGVEKAAERLGETTSATTPLRNGRMATARSAVDRLLLQDVDDLAATASATAGSFKASVRGVREALRIGERPPTPQETWRRAR